MQARVHLFIQIMLFIKHLGFELGCEPSEDKNGCDPLLASEKAHLSSYIYTIKIKHEKWFANVLK